MKDNKYLVKSKNDIINKETFYCGLPYELKFHKVKYNQDISKVVKNIKLNYTKKYIDR